jgi:hypothetical protein
MSPHTKGTEVMKFGVWRFGVRRRSRSGGGGYTSHVSSFGRTPTTPIRFLLRGWAERREADARGRFRTGDALEVGLGREPEPTGIDHGWK